MVLRRIFQKLLNFGVSAAFFALLEERTRPVDCVNQIPARVHTGLSALRSPVRAVLVTVEQPGLVGKIGVGGGVADL